MSQDLLLACGETEDKVTEFFGLLNMKADQAFGRMCSCVHVHAIVLSACIQASTSLHEYTLLMHLCVHIHTHHCIHTQVACAHVDVCARRLAKIGGKSAARV